MNINLKLDIPLKESDSNISIVCNTMLSPFYVTEDELLSTFLDKSTPEQQAMAREIIFKNSITADRSLFQRKVSSYTQEDIFFVKRQLTLCLSILDFGNKFHSDYLTSLSRTKTLAEFTVTTSSNNNPQFINNILKQAQQCVDDIKEAISLMGIGLSHTFVKGSGNSLNINNVARLWHHFNLPIKSDKTYAATKKYFNGRYYKNGGDVYTCYRDQNW